jgi:hypothetical protein
MAELKSEPKSPRVPSVSDPNEDKACNCTYETHGKNVIRIPSGNCPFHGSS